MGADPTGSHLDRLSSQMGADPTGSHLDRLSSQMGADPTGSHLDRLSSQMGSPIRPAHTWIGYSENDPTGSHLHRRWGPIENESINNNENHSYCKRFSIAITARTIIILIENESQ
jgi:hypothetical protein